MIITKFYIQPGFQGFSRVLFSSGDQGRIYGEISGKPFISAF